MIAGLRTPVEMIAIALEDDALLDPHRAKILADRIAVRLADVLEQLSDDSKSAVIHQPKARVLAWGQVANERSDP